MRLRQIKIAGFKSFVDPTRIDFPSNLTGVVGPNGCGKSNVIDAVRWVMGESSAKHLRGDTMEDVIFSGSSARKPVGQASVELMFDNSDGTLTGQYASYNEISVKRLVTREGQSKYFLNNSKCRRRDIADLFLGTGLGPRSYAIIEQGMVSRIIESRPEELRVYFEEAAGISKYKERRRETENRIRHTRENLERLNDLRDELEKQLARLDRQAKTAERYKRLKADERQIQAELLVLQLQHFEQILQQHKHTLEQRENRYQQTVAALRQVETQLEMQREALVEANEQHNKVQGEFYRVGADMATLEQQKLHQQQQQEQRQQQWQKLNSESQQLQGQSEQDQQRLLQLEQELEALVPELEKTAAQAKSQADALLAMEQQQPEWQKQWDGFQQHLSQLRSEVQLLQRNLEHRQQQVQRDQQRLQKLQQELQQLPNEDQGPHIVALQQQQLRLQEQLNELQQKQEQQQEQRDQLRQTIQQQQQDLSDQRTEVQELRGQLVSLETLQQHARGDDDEKLQQWLKAQTGQNGKRLAQSLRVLDPAWEKAIESLMADWLAASQVEALGNLLPQWPDQPAGTCCLLQNDRPETPSGQRDWPQMLQKIESSVALDSLFGQVYLCQDHQQLAALQKQLKVGETLLCSDGLLAGRNWLRQLDQDDPRQGLLAREQQITEIRTRVEAITAAALKLKSVSEGDQQRLQALEQALQQHNRQRNDIQKEISDLSNRQTRMQTLQEQNQQQQKRLQQEIDELQKQQQALQQQVEQDQRVLETQQNDLQQQEQQRGVQEQQRQERAQALNQLRQQSREQQNQLHRQQMHEQQLRAESQLKQQALARQQQQQQDAQQQQQKLQEQLQEGQAPLQKLQQELQEKVQLHQQSEQALSQSRQHLSQLDHQQRQLESHRQNCQQAVEKSRQEREKESLAGQETQVRRNTLAEQFAETGFEADDLLAELDGASVEQWQEKLTSQDARIKRLGPINLAAIEEHEEQSERKVYLDSQHADLNEALETLEGAIRKIDRETKDRFKETFDEVNQRMQYRFPRLFGGGSAHLELTENDLLNTGVAIMARPPGKRVSNIHLLSGGEKALTAVALIFAIFELNPSPFCMLDEVDAPLDDANVGRFCAMVEEMSESVQFIFISHNKITMDLANHLHGVTMHEPGASRLVSVDIDQAVQLADAG